MNNEDTEYQLPFIKDLKDDILRNAYEQFIKECCENNLYNRIIDSAKKNRTRINLIIFDINDKILNTNIPYCAVLQGTHKTDNKNALYNYWVRAYKESNLPPIMNEIDKRTRAGALGYTLRVYKYWFKKWAIELEWRSDKEHIDKITDYIEKYGAAY